MSRLVRCPHTKLFIAADQSTIRIRFDSVQISLIRSETYFAFIENNFFLLDDKSRTNQ